MARESMCESRFPAPPVKAQAMLRGMEQMHERLSDMIRLGCFEAPAETMHLAD